MVKNQTSSSQTKSIGLVAIVSAFNAVIGILQAFFVGRLFGTSYGIEIFFAASMVCQSMTKLLQAGQISEIFLPIYHQIKADESSPTAFRFFSVLLNWLVLISVGFSVVLFFATSLLVPLMVPGFDQERLAVCGAMFLALIPLICLQIIAAMCGNLLAAEKRFVSQEIVKSVAGLASLISIVILASTYDAWAMVGARWIAALLTFVMFWWFLRKIGYRHYWQVSEKQFSVLQIFKKLPSVFGYVCVSQVNAIVVTAGLSLLPQGSLAIYTYAMRLYSRVSGILVRPVSTVFFTHFSSAVAEGDAQIQKITIETLRLVLILSTATCCIVIATGLPALRALWLSDKFPEAQVFQTYLVFSVLCFAPIFTGLGMVFRKINMAHLYTHSQYFILIFNQIICGFAAWFLIPMLGLAGAVITFFLNIILSMGFSGLLLKRTKASRFAIYDAQTIWQCLIMFNVTLLLLLLLQHSTSFFSWFPDSRSGHLLASVVLFLLTMASLSSISHWLGVTEFRDGINFFKTRVVRLLGMQ